MSLLPLPSPPTDNLYKFMAITGVILFVGAPVYWATFYFELAEKRMAFEMAKTELQVEVLKYGQLPPPPRRGEQLTPGVSDAWTKQRETVAARLKELRLAEAQRGLFQHLSTIVNVLSISFWVIGIFIGFRGFVLWKKRVQQFQDQLLLLEVTRAKDESTGHGVAADSPPTLSLGTAPNGKALGLPSSAAHNPRTGQ